MSVINRKGFISVQILFIIILITTAVLSYGYIAYAQKQKDAFRKACFYDLAEIQKALVRSEQKLLLLNPQSTAIRLRLQFLNVVLAAAIVSENPPLIAKTIIDIKNTEALQQSLDKIQRFIILQAEAQLRMQILNLQYDLKSAGLREKSAWSNMLTEYRTYSLNGMNQMAIRPDSVGGIAPNYELQNNYNQLQKLRLHLHYSFYSNSHFQKYMPTTKSYKYICEVSFNKERDLWKLEINQDKLL